MEKLKVTHDHTLTDILKVLIFTLVLLIPGFMFLPSMLYFGFNEQANAPTKQVEIQKYIHYETNEVHTSSDLIVGKAYVFDLTQGFTNNENLTYPVEKLQILEGTYQDSFTAPSLSEVPYIRFYTNNRVAIVQDKVNTTDDLFPTYTNAKIAFVCSQYTNLGNLVNYCHEYNNYNDVITETETVVEITNQLEYNWEQIWQKPILEWTNTSILKNGLDNFTQAFGITNTSHINNLIAYELIMVGVYIVIDIVLALFKWLTHMIGNK